MQIRNILSRHLKRAAFAALAVGILMSPAHAQAGRAGIEGTWLTGNDSEITISRCGPGYCGRLSKIMVPLRDYKANKKNIEKIGVQNIPDIRNKDPKLRDRRLLGLTVLTLDNRVTSAKFEGQIYNPEDGNTYNGRLEVVDYGRLKLTGCALFNLICVSEDWVRVDRTAMPASCPSGQTRQFWLHCLGRD